MFIIDTIKSSEATGELKLLYRIIKKNLGFVPAHFELFATIDLQAMKDFLQYNQYFMPHEKIDKNLLPYLRLYIANKECRNYCVNFNSQMLLKMEVKKDIVENIEQNIDQINCNEKQKTLLIKTLKALYESDNFNNKDLQELYKLGFNDKDFYDLLSYASNFMSRSKLIEVYLK